MRLTLLLALAPLFASSIAAAAEPPLDFTLTWSQAEHSRDASGSRTVYTVKGDALTVESKSWGRMADLPPIRKEEPRKIVLTAAKKAELRAALEKTRGVTDVTIETQQDVGTVLDVRLEVKEPGGKARVVVLEGYVGGDHLRGPRGIVLDPAPDAAPQAPDAAPMVKTNRALTELRAALLGMVPLSPG